MLLETTDEIEEISQSVGLETSLATVGAGSICNGRVVVQLTATSAFFMQAKPGGGERDLFNELKSELKTYLKMYLKMYLKCLQLFKRQFHKEFKALKELSKSCGSASSRSRVSMQVSGAMIPEPFDRAQTTQVGRKRL